MRRAALVALGISFLLNVPTVRAAGTALSCPTIALAEQLNGPPPPGWVPPPPGWIGLQNPGPAQADYADFYADDPAAGIALQPAASRLNNLGGRVTWKLGSHEANVWLACHYGALLLTRRLPRGVRTCAVTFGVGAVVTGIACQ